MGVFCGGCHAHAESFPCPKCGWKPGDPKKPLPFGKEATPAMVDAGHRYIEAICGSDFPLDLSTLYRVMNSASPTIGQVGQGDSDG